MALSSSGRPRVSESEVRSTTSELQFANAFEEYLRSRKASPGIPRFDGIYREVAGTQGVADIVGVIAPNWKRTSHRLAKHLALVPRGPAAEIIAGLARPHTFQYLLKRSLYSRRVFAQTLDKLLVMGVVRQAAPDLLSLSKRFPFPRLEIIFFELKITKWQRALAQAAQAKLYANKSYCVFPAGNGAVMRQRELFRKMGIGVILFDAEAWRIREIVRTRKSGAIRRSHQLDVILRLSAIANGR